MEKAEHNFSQRNESILFVLLAFLFSWSIGIPLALAENGIIAPILPKWTHYLIPLGPLLSALLITRISAGKAGVRNLYRRMVYIKVCPRWWAVSFFPLVLGLLLVWLLNAVTGASIRVSDLGALKYLPALGLWALPFWFFTFGIGEETGWRGFLLPRMLTGRSALSATVGVAVIWALWHAPQFFYHYPPAMLPGWLVGLTAGSIILTWLYNSASNSIFMTAIWHACFNFITGTSADTGYLPMVISAAVIIWSLIVLIRHKPKDLLSL